MESRPATPKPNSELGEHTLEILRSWLGLSPE